MKRLVLFFCMILVACLAFAQGGMPFVRNYSPSSYKAHNRNFDIVTTSDGSVFVANFEGLLYYNKAEWKLIHTPNIARVTQVHLDSEGTVWAGGYNFIGKLEKQPNGTLSLRGIGQQDEVRGEVTAIWEDKKQMFFQLGNQIYAIKDNRIDKAEGKQLPVSKQLYGNGFQVTHVEPLGNGCRAVATNGNGVVVLNAFGKELYRITEQNGLCSNNVAHISYDGHGLLWGATDNGLFAVAVVSAYSQFSPNEGLRGEVLAIQEFNGKMFVGTLSGLFYRNGMGFERIADVKHACWMLQSSGNNLLAATSNGVYSISTDNKTHKLTTASTTSVLMNDSIYYSGEMDGVYINDWKGNRRKAIDLEKVTRMYMDADHTLWLQNLYGQIYTKKKGQARFEEVKVGEDKNLSATIVEQNGKMIVVSTVDTKPFPYPRFSYTDKDGILWLTNNEGEKLHAWKNGKTLEKESLFLYPLSDETVSAMATEGEQQWLGGDFGIVIIDKKTSEPPLARKPKLYIRSFVLNSDSIIWGGYGVCPQSIKLNSDEKNLNITFSIDHESLLGHTLYRYRLNNGSWSAWSTSTVARFFNHPSGSYQFDVQACDVYGRHTAISSIDFTIMPPFYMRWYMLVLYGLLLVFVVYLIVRWRLSRLEKEKIKLETIVQERTSEVVRQKDEIEEKSKSLENALAELSEAQGELIRQEKMATVGKLTQGLIDRILNPLNYINNFSKLSEGLVKDIEANIEDDKEKMDEENYEDTMDVLNMLHVNLQKVGEHGQNTTRTLKAMEEMLKDRSGGIVPMDLSAVLHQNEEMVRTYYADDIAKNAIKVTFDYPEELPMNGNAEQLSKTMMSLLANSIYAVDKKKSLLADYQPEVSLTVHAEDGKITIAIRDNGIGIEETIINKVFDPFFTTKTTGEAAGVGLYLSREIVQNHGGDITVKSDKNVYSEFTIILPILTT